MNKSPPTVPAASGLLPAAGTEGEPPPDAGRRGGGWGRFRFRHYLWGLGLLAAGASLVVMLASREFDWASISRTIAGFNSSVVILLMALLPLAGFPISVVYLVAGARFGPLAGLPVVAGVTAFHLLATYWITRSFLRAPLQRLLTGRGHRLPHVPPGDYAGVCVLGALVPGPPYFTRNYLLALTDIPLRTYFWVCLVVYVARSYVSILLGDLTSDPDRLHLAVLLGVYALKLAICAYVVWRLRRRHARAV